MKSLLLILFIGLLFQSFVVNDGEHIYKVSSFEHGNPLDIPFLLSGNFGEVRHNHFHSGLDIKTNGVIGLPVYNIADGYVSRIKVSPYGYGKALYIAHPSGYTSVYAHLDEFEEPIKSYLEAKQYEKKKSKIDLYIPANDLNIPRGTVIAKSGNSGGSGGPHLHFEIRESATSKALNPLMFGFRIEDKVLPIVKNIGIEAMDDQSGIFETNSIKSKNKSVFPLIKKEGYYTIAGEPIKLSGKMAFSIDVIDKATGSNNLLGVYKTTLKVDGVKIFECEKQRISFDESRYVNCFIDYKTKKEEKITLHRAYQLPGNFLSIYNTMEKKGIVNFQEEGIYHIEFILEDYAKNTTLVQFDIKGSKDYFMPQKDSTMGEQFLYFNAANHFATSDFSIDLPKYALYKSLDFHYSKTELDDSISQSSIHHVHYSSTPVHKYFKLRIKPERIPEYNFNKLVIVSINEKGEYEYEGGSWNGSSIEVRTRVFGDFVVIMDTIKPIIKPINVVAGKKISNQKTIEFEISDELSLGSYKLESNGHWLLTYYDAKKDRLIYQIDDKLPQGRNELKVTVRDKLNNVAQQTIVVNN